MATPNVSTTSTGMKAAVQQFDQTLTFMDGRLKSLQTQLNGIAWTSQSRKNFDSTIEGWASKYQTLYSHLAEMAQLMGANANDYEHREADAIKAGSFFK